MTFQSDNKFSSSSNGSQEAQYMGHARQNASFIKLTGILIHTVNTVFSINYAHTVKPLV